MMKTFIKLSLILSMIFTAAVSSASAEDNLSSIGLHAGLAFVGNGNGTKLNLGAQFDQKLEPPFGFGVYFDYVSLGSVQLSGTTMNYSNYLVHLLARGTYYFPSMSGLSAGIDLGPQFFVTNLTGASNSTDFAYGIHADYDYKVADNFTVGPEASLLLTTQNQGPTIVNLLAVAKYFF